MCDTTEFGIDQIPSKYRTNIADTDTDTFYLGVGGGISYSTLLPLTK